jgi:glycosyltransferase involved in cell wall biosynthesis
VAAEAAALGTPVVATSVGCHDRVAVEMIGQREDAETVAAVVSAAWCYGQCPEDQEDFAPRAFTERIRAAHTSWEE